MNKKNITISVLVLAIIGFSALQLTKNKSEAPTTPPVTIETTESTTPEKTDEIPADNQYADGQYSAIGEYTSPAQLEDIDIMIELEDSIIKDASFTGRATNKVSVDMQKLFADGFKQEVVGKPIEKVNLTIVNGASLTPKGFMDALEKIKQQAIES